MRCSMVIWHGANQQRSVRRLPTLSRAPGAVSGERLESLVPRGGCLSWEDARGLGSLAAGRYVV